MQGWSLGRAGMGTDQPRVFQAGCALTNTAFVQRKAPKKSEENAAKCPVFRNNAAKGKGREGRALLPNLLPPPGNGEVKEVPGILE